MSHEVLYFAHAVNCYNTPYEDAALALIRHVFPGAAIENPNQKHHEQAYVAKRAEAGNRDQHKAMDYFYDVVLPKCTGSVAMPFLDGRFGLGVAGELKKTAQTGKPIWGMFPRATWPAPAQLAAWVENPRDGLFYIRRFTDEELAELQSFTKEDGSPTLVLGHQETRLRTFLVYNGPKRPYEVAHLVSMPIPPGFYPEEKR